MEAHLLAAKAHDIFTANFSGAGQRARAQARPHGGATCRSLDGAAFAGGDMAMADC